MVFAALLCFHSTENRCTCCSLPSTSFLEPKTSNPKSDPMVSPAKVAADKSMKEKKRILPSWMLDSSPAKNTARGKKTTSKLVAIMKYLTYFQFVLYMLKVY